VKLGFAGGLQRCCKSAAWLRVGPLPKRTQRQRSFDGFAGGLQRCCKSAAWLRVGPLPKRTQRQRSFDGFAGGAYKTNGIFAEVPYI